MSTTLRVEISDEMKGNLEAAIAESNRLCKASGAPARTLADIVRGALAKGLDMPPNTPPEQLPLVAMTLAEFARVTGMGDLAASRAAAAKARADSEKIAEGMHQVFADVQRLVALHTPIRLRTPAEVTSWAEGIKAGMAGNPNATLVVAFAGVDEAQGSFPMPAPSGSN